LIAEPAVLDILKPSKFIIFMFKSVAFCTLTSKVA
jgi:hypothetical protein